MDSKSYNNSNNERLIKTMVAWKISENSDSEILNRIKSNFNDPEKFLDIDNYLILGKKIDKFKYKNRETLKSYHIIGDKEKIFPTIESTNKDSDDISTFPRKQFSSWITFNNKLVNSPIKKKDNLENFNYKIYFLKKTPMRIENNSQSNINKIEYLSNFQIEKMFEEKKEKLQTKSSKKLNSEIMKNIDPKCVTEMKEFLNKQEKALDNKEAAVNKLNNLAKFIAKKTQKAEKELLINKTDGFRLKNQCIQRIQSSNPIKPYKYGVYNDWKLNLREEEHKNKKINKNIFTNGDAENFKNRIGSSRIMNNPSKNLRKTKSKNDWGCKNLLNVRDDGDDLGMVVFVDNVQDIEQVVKPNTACLKDFRKYANNRTISSRLRSMNLNCEEMIGVNKLNVLGENLLNFEMQLDKNLNGKKFIVKEMDEKIKAECEKEYKMNYNKNELQKNKP